MIAASASGRVNLIGDHTDYNAGLVLPTPIRQRTFVEMKLRSDDVVNVSSRELGTGEYRLSTESRDGDWLDYVKACTVVLAEAGYGLSGFDMKIRSDVPLGSGLSSSAALEVAVLRALRSGLSLELDDFAIAMLAHRGETSFVGVPVGVMDPMASSLGREGECLFIDTRSLDVRRVALPSADLLVLWSGVGHDHVVGEYRRRRAECEEAARALGVPALRDVRDVARLAELPEPLGRRARHVVTENRRVERAVNAIECGALRELGELLKDSHASLRDDFDASIQPIDWLVEAANGLEDVYGARLTGGGFGGSIVALTVRGAAPAIAEDLVARYGAQTGLTAGVVVAGDLT